METKNQRLCRICLVENVRMYVLANTKLQEIYEKLTDIRLVTEDSRSMHACFICYAKLKQCHRFQRKCLEAEELLAQMLNTDYDTKPRLNRGQLEFSGYVISPAQHVDIFGDCQGKGDVIKMELPADSKGKDEEQEIDSDHEYNDAVCDDKSSQHSKSEDEGDSDDDRRLIELKIEVEEDQQVSQKKRKPDETKRASGTKKSKLEKRRTKLEDTSHQNDTEQADSTKHVAEFKPSIDTTTLFANTVHIPAPDDSLKKRGNYCVKCLDAAEVINGQTRGVRHSLAELEYWRPVMEAVSGAPGLTTETLGALQHQEQYGGRRDYLQLWRAFTSEEVKACRIDNIGRLRALTEFSQGPGIQFPL
ncbi:hypothetical protein PYW07_012534 [Mythimna separata]|uniref:ZAD domain-containing protein n=1 Tax=Mythimna separata TaxID=271217 RepID=A0AAD7Y8H7_MYTSE|nr:hypothetical protein PYW07_012534 [Mythimna separata]